MPRSSARMKTIFSFSAARSECENNNNNKANLYIILSSITVAAVTFNAERLHFDDRRRGILLPALPDGLGQRFRGGFRFAQQLLEISPLHGSSQASLRFAEVLG